MSDDFRHCIRQFKWKVQLGHPDLSYAGKRRENKPIFALEIPYPLLKEWDRLLYSGLDGKTVDSQIALDYITLLELSIPGSIFVFTDDQEIRSQINENLWKISASVAQLYKKTKGRIRESGNFMCSQVKQSHKKSIKRKLISSKVSQKNGEVSIKILKMKSKICTMKC